jgi:universal stress protein E
MSPATDIPGIDYESIKMDTTSAHKDKMQTFLQNYEITAENMHVVEGIPETAISDTAQKIKAQLVILGTVGRTGLAAAFIGNTAEYVLAELTCEVLALKPDLKNLEKENSNADY